MSTYLQEKRREIIERISELSSVSREIEQLTAVLAAIDVILATAEVTNAKELVVVSPPSTPASRAQPTRRRTRARKGSTSARKPRTASVKTDQDDEPNSPPAKRGRPKGSGTRGAEALAIVTASPGITIPEIAKKMGIKQNYLYRVLPGLAEGGKVKKDGTGWYPRDAA